MEKGVPKFKIGDKVKIKVIRLNDFPEAKVYGATIVNIKYGADAINRCWQYQVKYNDGVPSGRWLIEEIIKFPYEQFEAEIIND